MIKTISSALAMCCATLFSSLQAETLAGKQIGAWYVAAYSNDQTGQFSHCASTAVYRDNTLLIFSIAGQGWKMAISNPSWKMQPGAKFTFVYFVDSEPKRLAQGTAMTEVLAYSDLEHTKELFQLFRRGRELVIEAANRTFKFSLSGSSEALASTLRCADHYQARAPEISNPFGANIITGSTRDAPASTTADRPTAIGREARELAVDVLKVLNIQNYSFVDDTTNAGDVVWTNGIVVGGIFILPNISDAEAVMGNFMAADSKICGSGQFGSVKVPAPAGAYPRLRHICKLGDKATTVDYSIAARRKGGLVVFYVRDAEYTTEHSESEKIGSLIHDVVVKVSTR